MRFMFVVFAVWGLAPGFTTQAYGQIDPNNATVIQPNMTFLPQSNHESEVAVTCMATNGGDPYAAAGCIAQQLTDEELGKCLQKGIGGGGCFGESNTFRQAVEENIKAAGRESGVVAQILRFQTGISMRDIQKDGILGGNNSVFHCPLGGC